MNRIRLYAKLVHGCFFVLCILIVTALIAACNSNQGRLYKDDIYVVSPNGKYRLIIQEWGTIGATGAEIYIEDMEAQEPSLTRKKIGETTGEDSEYTFANGDYSVQWDNEYVMIRYYGGTKAENISAPETWRCIEYYLVRN